MMTSINHMHFQKGVGVIMNLQINGAVQECKMEGGGVFWKSVFLKWA